MLADVGRVNARFYPKLDELGSVANSGEHEHLRCVYRAGCKDDFATGSNILARTCIILVSVGYRFAERVKKPPFCEAVNSTEVNSGVP